MKATLWQPVEGGVGAPDGFSVGSTAAGIKIAGSTRHDLALVVSGVPAAAAAMYTTNLVQAAPVRWSQKITGRRGKVRAILLNSGNANACCGPTGRQAVQATSRAVAQALGCAHSAILVASTGAIGVPMPTARFLAGVPALVASVERTPAAATAAAQAIMTTDLTRKQYAVSLRLHGKTYTVGGMAKGSGMIHPNMATLLGVLTTDAPLSAAQAQRLLAAAVNDTFNAISVDGDTSTNDCLFLLANGVAGGRIAARSVAEKALGQAIAAVCAMLAEEVAKDGEGAKKLIVMRVHGAKNVADARLVARTIISSPLVKTAVAGGDPNWGRVMAAAGRAGVKLNPEQMHLRIGGHVVAQRGQARPEGEAPAAAHMLGARVEMDLHIGRGKGSATALGCDLTEGYIHINAHYRT